MDRRHLTFPGFKKKALTLSYDDGVRQDKRLIQIMQENGIKGTFNINSGRFNTQIDDTTSGRLTREEALDLYKGAGMEVAIHGYKHYSLASMDSAIALNEILSDRKELEETFDRIVNGMAYANGSYDDKVVEMLKMCGVKYSRTVISTEKFDLPTDWLRMPTTCHHNNPKLMDLAKEFIETSPPAYYWSNRPKLFYLWGHSYEFDRNDNWEVIEKFCKYVGNRNDVWYATNGEIYEYIQAYDNLVFSVDGDMIYNPGSITVYVEWFGKLIEIHAGETVKTNKN